MSAARARGRTTAGRARTQQRIELARTAAKPLLRGVDHGEPIVVRAEHVGAPRQNTRWVEPFLDANRDQLRRMDFRIDVAFAGELCVKLQPGNKIGAVPLASPATRKIVAGLVVHPRFEWGGLGDVMGRIGFAVEPRIGGGRLVPGSAREVPPWLVAGPVLRRIQALLVRLRRSFVLRSEVRTSPRGQIEWNRYAREFYARGQWHHLPCLFTEPDNDPRLLANVRWTLDRISDSLALIAPTPLGRSLLMLAATLLDSAGPGPRMRPGDGFGGGLGSELLAMAVEAMGWIADERGLGGSRALDGLSWDLAVDTLWEAWVASLMETVGPRLGFSVRKGDRVEHRLDWHGPVRSMRSLRPDVELVAESRVVRIDAKYKRHLLQLVRTSWRDVSAETQSAHRADLHQALAYAAIGTATNVDTVLAYPVHPDAEPIAPSVAHVGAGSRRVRVFLVGLPFGIKSRSIEERLVADWRAMLRLP